MIDFIIYSREVPRDKVEECFSSDHYSKWIKHKVFDNVLYYPDDWKRDCKVQINMPSTFEVKRELDIVNWEPDTTYFEKNLAGELWHSEPDFDTAEASIFAEKVNDVDLDNLDLDEESKAFYKKLFWWKIVEWWKYSSIAFMDSKWSHLLELEKIKNLTDKEKKFI